MSRLSRAHLASRVLVFHLLRYYLTLQLQRDVSSQGHRELHQDRHSTILTRQSPVRKATQKGRGHFNCGLLPTSLTCHVGQGVGPRATRRRSRVAAVRHQTQPDAMNPTPRRHTPAYRSCYAVLECIYAYSRPTGNTSLSAQCLERHADETEEKRQD